MRRHVRSLARLETLAFAISVFVPFLLCGAGLVAKEEASACCRAMQFKCHKTDGDSACCKQQSVAPPQPAIASASQLAPPQPQATVGLLPADLTCGLLGNQSGHRVIEQFPVHSPPDGVPLFLFHSTFLI
jgi:hypothetical protein